MHFARLWNGAVEEIGSIIARFPQRELEIRRRCGQDPRFASVCKDYEEAATGRHSGALFRCQSFL